jgi:hypothetical protein
MNSIFKAMVYTILVLGCANAHAVWSLGDCGWQGLTINATNSCGIKLDEMKANDKAVQDYMTTNFKPSAGAAAAPSAPPSETPTSSSSSATTSTDPLLKECGTCLECTPCTTP